MSELYICNKAKSAFCYNCDHSIPHKKVLNPYFIDTLLHENKNTDYCTKWGSCIDEDGNMQYKVRCIKVKRQEEQ